MRSIRKKITVCLMATVLIALVLVGTSSITLNYRSTIADRRTGGGADRAGADRL